MFKHVRSVPRISLLHLVDVSPLVTVSKPVISGISEVKVVNKRDSLLVVFVEQFTRLSYGNRSGHHFVCYLHPVV